MVRCAVVGLGWWGRHIAGKLQASEVMALGMTVDSDPAAGADATDLDTALGDPAIDAVVLCLPHSQHEEAIVRSARAGKHVFCEKPLTLTAVSARRALRSCRDAGVVLGVGHERRFEDPMQLVRSVVDSGTVGTVLHAEMSMSHDRFLTLPADHWRGSQEEAPAAGMTGMGVHLTDALISMFGAVDEVQAYTAARVLALPSGDVVSAHLRFRSGTIASISAVSATPFYGRFAIFGSHGWIEMRDDDHPEVGLGATVTTCLRGDTPDIRHIDAVTDAVAANLEAFAAAVEGRSAYPFTDAQLVHNVAVLEATARSASSGRAVPMTGSLSW